MFLFKANFRRLVFSNNTLIHPYARFSSTKQSTSANSVAKHQSTKVMDLVFRRLTVLKKQYGEVEAKLNKGEGKEEDRKEISRLAKFVSLHQKAENCYQNLEELQKMLKDNPNDKDTAEFVNDQKQRITGELQQLEEESIGQLIQPDMYDDYQEILVEFRPGVGGSESCLFIEDISNMFQSYFSAMSWQCKIVESQRDSAINKGFKFLSYKVVGPDCYKLMKCESGVHKVIRVPETESKGRLHSSTISVAVMPNVPFDYVVNDKDIRYQFTRSQGAGGQHVNKTDSACRAIHIPTGLAVFIQQDRQQQRNKKRATDLLKQRLFQIEYEKNMEAESQRRKVQIGSGDRSEKIRTYNYPQDRITDHRTGLTLFGIQRMLSGELLENFIKEYQDKMYKIKLDELLQNLQKD